MVFFAFMIDSFDAWTFYAGTDVNTTGNVLFQSREQATSEDLAFVNSAGNAIIKVDNTTDGANDPTFGRPSIKITSNNAVQQGSLVVMDALHVPFGVSHRYLSSLRRTKS